MTPNLRYNKQLTKYLLSASDKIEKKLTVDQISWGLENSSTRVYSLLYKKWFKEIWFFLQKLDDTMYRLIVTDHKKGDVRLYLIDNLEEFLNLVHFNLLDEDGLTDKIKSALTELETLPHTGIAYVEGDRLYLYDHENY